ncbi:hypothetical protein IE81DRAFT_4941 [Ceraceosorus guamensis]|uniref:Uncharacterized protein n=1 Tax=Ceraceosorus guamensis TaxID=1522189 RepID=A0A316WF41_9BASI|nr:hypothetical protein IE81DRAFT_4941 [Ceraceosorus guamensis]PWN46333.1 hypothetical protein IE81DRAFT_4941 [Ceraceosorus guamensis]
MRHVDPLISIYTLRSRSRVGKAAPLPCALVSSCSRVGALTLNAAAGSAVKVPRMLLNQEQSHSS